MENKTVRLSIREFALPSPRTGSIETHSGYGSAEQGIEIHQEVQDKRRREFPEYLSEVKLSRTFQEGGFTFIIEGRMDGIFQYDQPRIEEIKSSFSISELSKHLDRESLTHPYQLQLQTYGYFYFLETEKIPHLTFHLVSSRNGETRDILQTLNLEKYETWLKLRLSELVIEAIRAEKRSTRRRKIARKFVFPFDRLRRGQKELIEALETGFKKNKRMMIQAPTGLGKTVGVLYPSLKEALARGQRVIYVTPKNSQHSVAEEAIEKFQEQGAKLKSLTLTAKTKLCFKAEPICNPIYCEYARDYYDKLSENNLSQILSEKKKLTAKTFRALGEQYQVCPFELQLEAVSEADAVICDYNYVFSTKSALKRLPTVTFSLEGKPNLVIDEAHNLPSRAMEYFSPALSSVALEKMKPEFDRLPKTFRKEALKLIDQCIGVLVRCKPDGESKHVRIDPKLHLFQDADQDLRAFLSRYLDSSVEIEAKDPVLKLCFYWSEFTSTLEFMEGPESHAFFATFQPHPSGGIVKVTCCDASPMLRETYDDYDQVVAFSATLKPFDYYSSLSGLKGENLETSEFQSPFDPSKRKLLIIPQISTKFSEREKNYPKIAEVISKIVSIHEGNYLAFFPSFEFMERVADLVVLPIKFEVIRQFRQMPFLEIEGVLDHLKSNSAPTVLFAVQGGVFSEGVDYKGKMVEGAFVIGPPLPNFDVERETMKRYYEENFNEGFNYAYAYPAMAKSVQAAGRVIRSEEDQGIIVLMDSRFLNQNYTQSMPEDWFQKSPSELVSSQILKDVSEFWKTAQPDEIKSDVE